MGRLTRSVTLALLLAASGLLSPARAQFWGGKSDERITFVLCIGVDCAPGQNLTSPWISFSKGKVTVCKATAKTPPAGDDIIIDVKVNGASIFGAVKLVIPDGSGAVTTQKTFANPNLAEDDLVTVDIVQVGAVTRGKDLSVACKIE